MSRICYNGYGRLESDGTVWLTQAHKDYEALLDRTMLRTKPGQRRWVPRPEPAITSVEQLRDTLAGQQWVVYGKGPSLDKYTAEHPEHSIGINETVLRKQCTYGFVLDGGVLKRIKGYEKTLIVDAKNVGKPFPKLMFFDWGRHTTPGHASAACVLELLAMFGVKDVLLVGFDSLWQDNMHVGYAECLGDLPPRGSEDYSAINQHIEAVAIRHGMLLRLWGSPDDEIIGRTGDLLDEAGKTLEQVPAESFHPVDEDLEGGVLPTPDHDVSEGDVADPLSLD